MVILPFRIPLIDARARTVSQSVSIMRLLFVDMRHNLPSVKETLNFGYLSDFVASFESESIDLEWCIHRFENVYHINDISNRLMSEKKKHLSKWNKMLLISWNVSKIISYVVTRVQKINVFLTHVQICISNFSYIRLSFNGATVWRPRKCSGVPSI